MNVESPTLTERIKSVGLWRLNLSFLVPSMSAITLAFSAIPAHKVDFLSKWYCRTQNHTNHLDHIAMYNTISKHVDAYFDQEKR